MILTPPEQNFLKGLQENPMWVNILKKLENLHEVPRYKPSKDEEQKNEWIYRSGGMDASESLLTLLRGE